MNLPNNHCSILSGFLAIVPLVASAAETSDANSSEGFGWELVAILFVIGMALSVFHSISMLRKSSKPGPAYWAKRFEQACTKRDPRQAEQALLFWAKSVWGTDAPDTLNSLARRIGEDAAGQQVLALKAAKEDSSAGSWNAYLCRQVLAQRLQQIATRNEESD